MKLGLCPLYPRIHFLKKAILLLNEIPQIWAVFEYSGVVLKSVNGALDGIHAVVHSLDPSL